MTAGELSSALDIARQSSADLNRNRDDMIGSVSRTTFNDP